MRKRARSTEKGAGRWALICFLSGLVLAMAYNVQAVWFLCFLAPISLFAALMKEPISAKRCFFRVFCFFGGYYAALLYWFGEMISVVGSSLSPVASVLVMVLAIVLVSAIESTMMGVVMLPFAWLRNGTLRDVPALAALVVLGEWLIGQMGTLAFPWARMANLAAPAPWFVQSAGLLGGLFVSGIILCVAGFAAFALLHGRRDRRLACIAALCAEKATPQSSVAAIMAAGPRILSMHFPRIG